MSNPKPKPSPVTEVTEAEVDGVLAEFSGDARAAVRALLEDQVTLFFDADRSVSRGYLRGLFSEGARPARGDDDK